MTDAELRRSYARLLAARAAGSQEPCLTPEALLELAEGGVPEVERFARLRHVGSCASCRAELDLLRAVVEGARRLERPRVPVLALAASVAILSLSLAVWRIGLISRGDADAMRGAAGGVKLVAPVGGEVARRPVVLVWRQTPGVVRYEIEVLAAGGALLYAASTPDTVLTIPDATRVEPEQTHYWWVRAIRSDGTQFRSPAEPFRVQAR